MTDSVRLAYASTATASPSNIRRDLMHILDESRLHYSNHHLNGILLYGNDLFFGCLEGEKKQVDDAYTRLLLDGRHKKIKLLFYEPIQQLKFQRWSMRFVHFEPTVQHFFKMNISKKFNPYVLNNDSIHTFLELLFHHVENIPLPANDLLIRLEGATKGSVLNPKYIILLVALAFMLLSVFYIVSYYGLI